MKKPGSNTANKIVRQERVVQLCAKRYSNRQIAESLGVSEATVERDIREIRQRGLDTLTNVTAETWAADCFAQYEERVAELRERLAMVGPRDHQSAVRIYRLLQLEDAQITRLWLRLGLLQAVPPHELTIVRVTRTMQQLPPNQLEEIYNAIGSEEEFARLFRRLVQVPPTPRPVRIRRGGGRRG